MGISVNVWKNTTYEDNKNTECEFNLTYTSMAETFYEIKKLAEESGLTIPEELSKQVYPNLGYSGWVIEGLALTQLHDVLGKIHTVRPALLDKAWDYLFYNANFADEEDKINHWEYDSDDPDAEEVLRLGSRQVTIHTWILELTKAVAKAVDIKGLIYMG